MSEMDIAPSRIVGVIGVCQFRFRTVPELHALLKRQFESEHLQYEISPISGPLLMPNYLLESGVAVVVSDHVSLAELLHDVSHIIKFPYVRYCVVTGPSRYVPGSAIWMNGKSIVPIRLYPERDSEEGVETGDMNANEKNRAHD